MSIYGHWRKKGLLQSVCRVFYNVKENISVGRVIDNVEKV